MSLALLFGRFPAAARPQNVGLLWLPVGIALSAPVRGLGFTAAPGP